MFTFSIYFFLLYSSIFRLYSYYCGDEVFLKGEIELSILEIESFVKDLPEIPAWKVLNEIAVRTFPTSGVECSQEEVTVELATEKFVVRKTFF